MTDENVKELWYDLRFDCERSRRYHSKRESFYGGWHKFTTFVGLMLASAAVSSALSTNFSSKVLLVIGIITAMITTVDLVVGTSQKAWEHASLRKQYVDLVKKLSITKPSQEAYDTLLAEYYDAEKEETPIKKVLNHICHVETTAVLAHKEIDYKYGWLQRTFAQIV